MEKGTLHIEKTKSGKLIAWISFVKSDGKSARIDVIFWAPKEEDINKYNNTSCEFLREKGTLIKVSTHDGVLREKSPTPAMPQGSSSSGSVNMGGNSIQDSYDPVLTLLPADTKETLRRINPDNFALKWQKAARYVEGQSSEKNKFMFFKRERKGENFEIRANFDTIDFKQIAHRELRNAKAILGDNYIRETVFRTQWRLVQGLGHESVYETSMTLHHIYGIPYIPATSLKGVIRSWIIETTYYGKEEEALADPRFCDWFGCPAELVIDTKQGKQRYPSYYKAARRGALVFFDAYPIEPPSLRTDVMNPHYAPYYSDKTGKTPPADYHQPIPVFFLTVEETPFQFIVGSREKDILNQTLRNGMTIFDCLKYALTEHGIGAKTSVGYGYMKPV